MLAWRRRCQVGRVWAYAYQIVPPQPKRGLEVIRDLLDHEHIAAQIEARIWAGRLVLERRVTRILIVSDRPPQEGGEDQTLTMELQRLPATVTRTASMEITADAVEP